MKFFVDESVDAPIAWLLRAEGHEVFCVWELEPGISDEKVLAQANQNGSILLTADKDFGELVFRLRKIHLGVLLIRLPGLQPEEKAKIVNSVIELHGQAIPEAFTVITPKLVKIRR